MAQPATYHTRVPGHPCAVAVGWSTEEPVRPAGPSLLTAANALTRQALGAPSLDDLYHTTLCTILDTLAIPWGRIRQADSRQRLCLVRASAGWPVSAAPPPDPDEIPPTVAQGHTLQIADLRADLPAGWSPLAAAGMVSGVVATIGRPDHLYGTLELFTARPHRFTADEIQFVELVAGILAAALDRRTGDSWFARAFHASPDPTCLVGLADGRLRDANECWVAFFGYTRAEAVGRTASELQIWADPAQRTTIQTQSRTIADLDTAEVTMRRRTGEERQVRLATRILQGDDPCILVIIHDVTEERRAATALRVAEARFAAAFAASPTGLSIVRLTDDQTLHVNPAWERLMGYRHAEVTQTRFACSQLWRDPGQWRALRAALGAGGVREWEVWCQPRTGPARLFSVSAEVIEALGTLCMLLIYRDITAEHTARQQTQALTHRLQTLLGICRAILAAATPAAVAGAALERLPQILPCAGARVVLLPAAPALPTVLAVQGAALPWPPPARIGDAAGQVAAGLHPAGAYLRVPLIARGQAIGLLEVWDAQPRGFGPAAVRIGQEIADHLALALHQAQVLDAMTAGQERLTRLSRQVIETQETERRHLARELHDDVGQALTALKLGYQVACAGAGATGEPLALLDEVLAAIRRLAHDLRPPLLDELGLVAALESYLTRQATRAGLVPCFTYHGPPTRWAPGVEATAFRVAQEAITNVLRHAQARQVGITVTAHPDRLDLCIGDDGRGFSVAAAQARAQRGGSLGLLTMQERAVLVGGQIVIESAPGAGTQVRVQLPLPTTGEVS